LISSAGQLGREGVQEYVDSFTEAQNKLLLGRRKECRVMPAPFVLTGGCDNVSLTRSIFEFHAWVQICGLDLDGVLNDAFGAVEHHIRNCPGDWAGPMQDMCLKLPLNLPNPKKTNVLSAGPTNLPKSVVPIPEHVEKLIITSMLIDIKTMLGFNIDTDPSTNR
jgi:hypothetical protein